ncbi:MAG TPA: GDSL-type esterase/lipase family protein [Pseudonocardiaceae bacterium]|jgi:lysophospholipase L1-like esterase|nr:GDSL-type esterase/lipase family protein [Pseudonocardiaceae bacterium]
MKSLRQLPFAAATILLATTVSLIASSSSSAQGNSAAANGPATWSGSWTAATTAAETSGSSNAGFDNQSIREIVHLSIGGDRFRVRLTNALGQGTLSIGHATVAKQLAGATDVSDIDPSTLHDLTFQGQSSATVLKGDDLLSDPVNMHVGNLTNLVITIFLPTATGPVTWHAISVENTYIGPGDLTTAPTATPFTLVKACCWYFLSGVDVQRNNQIESVVVLGDSLADGSGNTLNANANWPDDLARRIVQSNRPVESVLNESLAGNRLDHEGTEPGDGDFPGLVQLGTNTDARLAANLYAQNHPHTVLFDLGINDIWISHDSSAAIISSIRRIAADVHEHGMRFVVGTLGPFQNFDTADGIWTPAKEATRTAVNTYLRTTHDVDGVVDFDAVLRDPANPAALNSVYDSGDGIHPNDAGSQAMANAIPLGLLY